jgi:hypothetical protein
MVCFLSFSQCLSLICLAAQNILLQNVTICPAGVNYQLNLYVNDGQTVSTSQIQLTSPNSTLTGGTLGSIVGCQVQTNFTSPYNTYTQIFPLNGTAAVTVNVGNGTQWQHLSMDFTSGLLESSGTLAIGVSCPGLAGQNPGGAAGETIGDLLTGMGIGTVNIGVDSISLDYPYVT